jgi:hypothetical protein
MTARGCLPSEQAMHWNASSSSCVWRASLKPSVVAAIERGRWTETWLSRCQHSCSGALVSPSFSDAVCWFSCCFLCCWHLLLLCCCFFVAAALLLQQPDDGSSGSYAARCRRAVLGRARAPTPGPCPRGTAAAVGPCDPRGGKRWVSLGAQLGWPRRALGPRRTSPSRARAIRAMQSCSARLSHLACASSAAQHAFCRCRAVCHVL